MSSATSSSSDLSIELINEVRLVKEALTSSLTRALTLDSTSIENLSRSIAGLIPKSTSVNYERSNDLASRLIARSKDTRRPAPAKLVEALSKCATRFEAAAYKALGRFGTDRCPPTSVVQFRAYMDTVGDMASAATGEDALPDVESCLPTRFGLETILDLGNVNPAVPAVFNTVCTAGCTVTTCSCTRSSYYWSSSAGPSGPYYAWFVFFSNGYVYDLNKASDRFVRAVRSGS
jgi:hypothetical protein